MRQEWSILRRKRAVQLLGAEGPNAVGPRQRTGFTSGEGGPEVARMSWVEVRVAAT